VYYQREKSFNAGIITALHVTLTPEETNTLIWSAIFSLAVISLNLKNISNLLGASSVSLPVALKGQ
jgi:hypothetical protein